jgi:predicted DNA binding CopG/RHH family protein
VQNEKLNMLMMMAKIPGLSGLDIPIERLPTDAEFSAISADLMAAMDAEFQAEIVFDYDAIDAKRAMNDAALRSMLPVDLSSSKRITVRIPTKVLAAVRVRAKATGTKYQTLLNRTLSSAVAGWEVPASHP